MARGAPSSCLQRLQSPGLETRSPIHVPARPTSRSHTTATLVYRIEIHLVLYRQFIALESSALTPATDQALIHLGTSPWPNRALTLLSHGPITIVLTLSSHVRDVDVTSGNAQATHSLGLACGANNIIPECEGHPHSSMTTWTRTAKPLAIPWETWAPYHLLVTWACPTLLGLSFPSTL